VSAAAPRRRFDFEAQTSQRPGEIGSVIVWSGERRGVLVARVADDQGDAFVRQPWRGACDHGDPR